MLFNLVCLANDKTPDFRQIPAGPERVNAFVKFMLPKIEKINQKVCRQRQAILETLNQLEDNKSLKQNENERILQDATLYQQNISSASEANLSALLARVNIIPISIVLAQAAVESGWGTSRFARSANNYFGEHCFEEGCGMSANKSSHVEVSEFKTVYDSIDSYYLMLNSRMVFSEFRKTRQTELQKNKKIDIDKLLASLTNYSGIGEKYPKILISIIKKYHFEKYDTPKALCLIS